MEIRGYSSIHKLYPYTISIPYIYSHITKHALHNHPLYRLCPRVRSVTVVLPPEQVRDLHHTCPAALTWTFHRIAHTTLRRLGVLIRTQTARVLRIIHIRHTVSERVHGIKRRDVSDQQGVHLLLGYPQSTHVPLVLIDNTIPY